MTSVFNCSGKRFRPTSLATTETIINIELHKKHPERKFRN